jgi:hypothetical protein
MGCTVAISQVRQRWTKFVELEKLYALKPASVIRKIATSQNMKLHLLSDAFRAKNN